MKTIYLQKKMTDAQVDKLTASYVDESYFDTLITEDCDVFDMAGKLLARFRKGVLPLETLKLGVEAFKKSIKKTQNRGHAAGGTFYAFKKDGTKSAVKVAKPTTSGIVGALEGKPRGLNNFCRLSSFTANYFEMFKSGIPFVKAIDSLYAELAPEHYKVQREYAKATNRNYIIGDTVFSTLTINKNFRTAVHQDSGDLPQGFGNLIAYREGDWFGSYFCLPQYRVAFDLQNTDVLFVDVHKHHANTPAYYGPSNYVPPPEHPEAKLEITNWPDDQLRITFVLYYREEIIKCKSPSDELKRMKNTLNFNKL